MMFKRIFILIFILLLSSQSLFAQDAKGRDRQDARSRALRYRAMEVQMRKARRFMALRQRAMEEAMRKIADKRQRLMEEAMRSLAQKAKQRFFFMVRQALGAGCRKISPITPR